MKLTETNIKGLLIIEPDVFYDSRGYFFESYNKRKLQELGFSNSFVQDNISKSKYGTLRGLHYQKPPFGQGKLVQVLLGKVLDVAVDIRFGSPTFGKYFSIELSEANKLQFWIPEGFAHGFVVLSDEAIFHYKCTEFYNKESERNIIFNDKILNIDWKIENPILSEKDKNGRNFSDIEKDFFYNM